ncbi:MAG: DNA-directed RNA polymerase subunit alpha [Phycisphaerales bacterium]|nr:DNA-directed RNA polymerase subunit alpha [Phycisphaerales bacterium]
MRIRWRGLELPSEVIRDVSVSTDTYGRFMIEPFERGFGTTVGNSLRRILLSSLEGAAVTSVKIAGASHEFMSLPGVLEDVTDIILNIKGIVVCYDGEEPRRMRVVRRTRGEVRAGDIEADTPVEVLNSDHVLATLTDDVHFGIEMEVKSGRGYSPASENAAPEQEIGVIPVDSVYSPVVRVRYRTEETRVGQRTNFDRLILDVWTNGTVAPEDAIVEAARILRKHLNPFIQYHDLGSKLVHSLPVVIKPVSVVSSELEKTLHKPVADLDLSVRASNCLEAARINTIGELVRKTESDLLRLRSFGKTSLREVRRKLADAGLSLGMVFDGDSAGPASGGGSTAGDDGGDDDASDEGITAGIRHDPREVSVHGDAP